MLYAPGLATADEIRAVCSAVSKPVNVLARPNLTLAEIVEAGGRRVSVGGALTWTAVGAFVEAATAIRDQGELFLTRRQLRLPGLALLIRARARHPEPLTLQSL